MVAPVPLAASAVGELVALLANEIFAEAVPAPCGAKVTVNATLCPAGIVTGRLIPFKVKSELLELPEFTVTLDPDALRVPLRVCVVPIVTFPKLMALGETASDPAADAPVPDSATPRLGFDPFDATVTVPLKLPLVAGANVIDAATLCPGANVAGREIPLMLNPVPVTES